MNSFVALIVYFALVIISTIIKKIVEEKGKQTRIRTEAEEFDPHNVSLEDILAGETSFTEDFLTVEENIVVSEVKDGRESNSEEEIPIEFKRETNRTIIAEDHRQQRRKINLVDAVIMSEIIKQPRAQRPWPNR